MDDKYRQYVRANLFGVMLRVIIDFIGKQHMAVASEVLLDILGQMFVAADHNKVSQKDFLQALEPDLEIGWKNLRKLAKRPRRWKTLTEGERMALMQRFLMYFHYHAANVVPEKMLGQIMEESQKKTCTERRLQKEVVAGTMFFTAQCVMSKKKFRELQESLSKAEPESTKSSNSRTKK